MRICVVLMACILSVASSMSPCCCIARALGELLLPSHAARCPACETKAVRCQPGAAAVHPPQKCQCNLDNAPSELPIANASLIGKVDVPPFAPAAFALPRVALDGVPPIAGYLSKPPPDPFRQQTLPLLI